MDVGNPESAGINRSCPAGEHVHNRRAGLEERYGTGAGHWLEC
jgi:hypothetical protein